MPAQGPRTEQLLSAGFVCFALFQAAQALGFGAQCLTGWAAYDPAIGGLLGVRANEKIVASSHRHPRMEVPERDRPDAAARWAIGLRSCRARPACLKCPASLAATTAAPGDAILYVFRAGIPCRTSSMMPMLAHQRRAWFSPASCWNCWNRSVRAHNDRLRRGTDSCFRNKLTRPPSQRDRRRKSSAPVHPLQACARMGLNVWPIRVRSRRPDRSALHSARQRGFVG